MYLETDYLFLNVCGSNRETEAYPSTQRLAMLS